MEADLSSYLRDEYNTARKGRTGGFRASIFGRKQNTVETCDRLWQISLRLVRLGVLDYAAESARSSAL